MTKWFLDASVIIASVDEDDSHRDAARSLLAGRAALHTLDLAYYETANTTARRWGLDVRAARVRRLVDAIAEAGGLVKVDSALVAHMAELAEQHGLSAYDAGYVAGASRVGATLVSCDQRDLVGPGLAITPEQALEA